MIYALADTHLSCALKTNKSMEVFGSSWKDYMERIRESCYQLLKPHDILLIPGDISWAMQLTEAEADLAFLHDLPGLKVLVRGNHDYWWTGISKMHQFCAEKGYNSLIFTRFEALKFILANDFSLKNFKKEQGVFQKATYKGEVLDNQTLYEHFACLKSNSSPAKGRDELNADYSLGEIGIVLAATRAWLSPYEKIFQTKDKPIYERECIRLKMALTSAHALKKPEDVLLLALHYPPMLKGHQPMEFQQIIEEFGVDLCISGHLHGFKIRQGKTGIYGHCLYENVSADRLQMTPLVLPLCKNISNYQLALANFNFGQNEKITEYKTT